MPSGWPPPWSEIAAATTRASPANAYKVVRGLLRGLPGRTRGCGQIIPYAWRKPVRSAGPDSRLLRRLLTVTSSAACRSWAGCEGADQPAWPWLVTWPGAARLPCRSAGWVRFPPLLVHHAQLSRRARRCYRPAGHARRCRRGARVYNRPGSERPGLRRRARRMP